MTAIKLPTFAGMIPSIDDHLLADQNASFAENTWLYSGALIGLPVTVELADLQSPASTVAFRIPINDGNPSYMYDSYWMEFENSNTDFIKAPTAGDTFERYYWTSPSQEPMYNTRARILAGYDAWILGLPQPGDITVTAAGGSSSTLVSRAYVTTLVTEYGEEGPASDPFLINGKQDDNYTVVIAAVAASDMGVDRNVTNIRLYRTITSSAGTADYYLVAELPASTVAQNYVDTMSDSTLSGKSLLESTAWSAPPDLDGMVAMPNGITAGFVGNELWFSAAYRPHAWPAAYSLSLEHEIVGLGVIGQTLVVCTVGNPQTASGVNPSSITTSKLASFEPCINKGSIVSTEQGVYYASPNGLILVNSGIAENITKQYISRDRWNDIVDFGRINAGHFGSAYFAFGSSVQGIFQSDAFQQDFVQGFDDGGASNGFLLDPTNQNVGFSFMGDDSEIKSLKNDMLSGEIVIVKEGKIWWLDQQSGFATKPYIWRSKIYQPTAILNFSAFKTYFYEDPEFEFLNPQNFNKDQVFDPETQLGVVRVYADGKLLLAHELRKSGELHRLPTGFKATFWQIEFEATIRIKNFQMATSIKELASV